MRDMGTVHGLALFCRIGIVEREYREQQTNLRQFMAASTASAILTVPSVPPYSIGLMPPE